MKTKTLLVLALTLSFATAYAQNEEQVLNSAPINVDGYLAEERPVTDGELEQIKGEIRKQKNEVHLNKEKSKGFKELSKTTEKLSETTEEYLDEKKDAQKDIAEYNAKIKCLMEENPGADCDKYIKREPVVQEVAVAQAAPVATSAENFPVGPSGKPFETIKLLPYIGGTQFNGKVEQLEAELAGGLRLESNISTRFSMGIGLNYTSLKTQDFANNGFAQQPAYNQGYYGAAGYGMAGREIQYSSMGFDIYGKFFITQGERFRPYLGAGLGYNRASMNYTENNQYQTPNTNLMFGDEKFQTSFFKASLSAGTEIMITRGFGLNIEAGYATGLGNSVSSQNAKSPINSPDQQRLRQLGEEIINASAISIFAGAVIIF